VGAMAEDGAVQSNASNKRPREEAEDLGVPGAKSCGEALQQRLDVMDVVVWAMAHICPLSKELAVFPVCAEDGMTYDLGAFAKYCGDRANTLPSTDMAQGTRVKSPATGLPMSTHYFPCVDKQAAMIQLFRNGRFGHSSLSGVTSKLKKYLDLRERAWSRDIDAIRELVEFLGAYNPVSGDLQTVGSCGAVDGVTKARNWWLRVGAEGNDKHCMARFGTELYAWIASTDDMETEEEAPRLQQAIASIAGSAELVDEAALTMARMYLDGLFDEQDGGRPRLDHETHNLALLKKGVLKKAEKWLNKALHTSGIDKTKRIDDRMREDACGVLAKVRRALEMKDEGVAADKDPQWFSSGDIDTSDGGANVPCDDESELHELNFYLGYDEHKDKWQ